MSVQEAAAKLRSLTYRGNDNWRTPDGECLDGFDVAELRAELAREYLALVRPDDGEKISEEWLLKVGFEQGAGVLLDMEAEWGWLQVAPFEDCPEWQICGNRLEGPQTRGETRLLCRALGIPLKDDVTA